MITLIFKLKIFYLGIKIYKKTMHLTSTKNVKNARLPNFMKICRKTKQKDIR